MNNKALTFSIVVIAFIAGWYLLSPLFIDQVVDEDFPDTSIPTPEELADMSEEELALIKDETMDKAALMPDKVMEEVIPVLDKSVPESVPEPTSITRGVFEGADSLHRGSGEVTAYELPNGKRILRFEDFSVTNGPDLRVVLSANKSPKNKSEVKDDGFLLLADLKGNVGNQNYDIPDDVDLSEYASVVIYCYPFNVVFATANLN